MIAACDAPMTRGMGQLPELFRYWPGTIRSNHPFDSFLANGPQAMDVTQDHAFESSLGPGSPLGYLYDHGAKVLMLGAGFGSCTSFHLAEHGLPGQDAQTYAYPARRLGNVTRWEEAENPPSFEHLFEQIGAEFIAAGHTTAGFGGNVRLFEMARGVDFARNWLLNADPAMLDGT